MKTLTQFLTGKKTSYKIINEKGETLEKFRLKTTANQWLARMKLTKREKLEVIELTEL